VVGAIIGADIYVASALGAGLLGPFSLVAWVVAGIIAILIALCFAQCSALLPKVGGPYAYARAAWGPFAGFIVGWSLWLAEWISLAVFPVAFTQYLMFFLPSLNWISQVTVRVLFVVFLIVTNVVGVRAAGRTNDILTVVKLVPLAFFAVIGLLFMVFNASTVTANFSTFAPLGFGSFGAALVLIFWAYAGFEISTIPADTIQDPGKTIPKAIIIGISIVTIFYLVTNIVLFGVRPWTLLALDKAPLTAATGAILVSNPTLALIGIIIVGVGALISVSGSDESGMIGTSRLGYALAADGLFPKVFARIHPRFKTPYLGIIISAVTALVAALFGNLSVLIATSVFFMAFAYAATGASTFFLQRKETKTHFNLRTLIIPILGVIFSVYLITQCSFSQIALGLILLFVGVPIYIKYSPKKEIAELKSALVSPETILKTAHAQEERFLAHVLKHIKNLYRKRIGKKQGQDLTEQV
jgi:amino acid transporter